MQHGRIRRKRAVNQMSSFLQVCVKRLVFYIL